jgi:hypothetical protein
MFAEHSSRRHAGTGAGLAASDVGDIAGLCRCAGWFAVPRPGLLELRTVIALSAAATLAALHCRRPD